MKFTIDENVPLLVATALQSAGHDCLVMAQVDPRASDEEVLARSRREGRVLVTFNGDFGRMIFHEQQPSPPGVVYMRGRPDQALSVSQSFVALFATGTLDITDRFMVIDPSGAARTLPLRHAENG